MPLSASTPFSFVLFGASGHLAKLKLYPSLYTLALKKRLPKDYAIVGYARTEMDDAGFRKLIADAVLLNMIEVNAQVMEEFLSHCHYHQGQYTETQDFVALKDHLETLENGWKSRERLAYFSVPPSTFADIAQNLCKSGTHDKSFPFRCIVEKPIGNTMQEFEDIISRLTQCFHEDEVFLLDHYLGKEAVRNIFYLRYSNPILERLFKNSLIHHVEITALESAGLEGRAGYFEHTGTLRDMFQSHLVLVPSLLTMVLGDPQQIRSLRANALAQFYLPPVSDFSEVVVQGQYASGSVNGKPVIGYTAEDGIAKDSRTNTYIALKLLTRAPSFSGVPFYLRSGKRLQRKETRISIEFQEIHPVGKGATRNRLDIILHGEAGMRMHLQTKLGGTEPAFRPLVMEDPLVCIGDCLPEHSLLLLEAMSGNQDWFLTVEEVRSAWRLISPVQSYLEEKTTPLHSYAAGTLGPKEAEEWIGKEGVKWFD
ncbi:MAG: glucose-6-phosphate dehydrogenase [Candidatus Peregrinibacteria bacterium]